MDPWIRVNPETGEVAPRGVDPQTGRFPPNGGVFALAAGVVAAVVLFVGVAIAGNRFHAAIFASPFLLGVVVGASTARRPLRNAAWTLLVSAAVLTLALQSAVMYLILLVPLSVPEVAIGALCGHTLRRFLRARRFEAFLPPKR